MVLGEIRQTARATGRPYRARFARHGPAEDGRAARHPVYEGGPAASRASG